MADQEIEIVKGVKLSEYQAMKAAFEGEGYFQALPSGKVIHPENKRLMSKADAAEQLSVKWRFPTGNGCFIKDTLFLPIWLKDPSRKQAAWVEAKEPKKVVKFE
jgi:hypothetical protein